MTIEINGNQLQHELRLRWEQWLNLMNRCNETIIFPRKCHPYKLNWIARSIDQQAQPRHSEQKKKKKSAHQGGHHALAFIKFAQRTNSTPCHDVWHHPPTTKLCSSLTRVPFSSLSTLLSQDWCKRIPQPWAVSCRKPPLSTLTEQPCSFMMDCLFSSVTTLCPI